MIDRWIILASALAYVCLLFVVAYYGDSRARDGKGGSDRPFIYALSLAIYCTSWTFFGSVGLAATTGLDFIPVYLGPVLMLTIALPLFRRVIDIAKSQNITSIADFIAARYGKSARLAAIVTLIAVAGTIPYIALQLKAVSTSVSTLLSIEGSRPAAGPGFLQDISLAVALAMAAFAALFGTRHVDATERQDGLMLAVATESVVKVVAFLAVGLFVTYGMLGGLGDLAERVRAVPAVSDVITDSAGPIRWLSVSLLSFVCILLLPRQFHVGVVENHSQRELTRASWLFPAYLVLINLFVVPIAAGGLLLLPQGSAPADMFVLALPLSAEAGAITTLAFIGGLSAATAMVIVESVALAIMVCNDLAMPLILRRAAGRAIGEIGPDLGQLLLNIRRGAIIAIIALAYLFHHTISQSQGLASIGLLSFAAIAQFAPAFFGGLIWRRATADGAICGILAGFGVWAYTLLLPWFQLAGLLPAEILDPGPFGISWLRPQHLLGVELDPLSHGVLWSLSVNLAVYVAASYLRLPRPLERLQANHFIDRERPMPSTPSFRLWRTAVTVEDLRLTAARYVGSERADRSFAEYAESRKAALSPHAEADLELIDFTMYLLASAIGAASSRLVMSLLLQRRHVGNRSAVKLLEDASEAIHYNRGLLQTALDQVSQGLIVCDQPLRLMCWNRRFSELLELPPDLVRVGAPLGQLLVHLAERGDFGPGAPQPLLADWLQRISGSTDTLQIRIRGGTCVIEVRSSPMPQGGIVTTFTDITERVNAAEQLARANETLEGRVRERTGELIQLNKALAEAKGKADQANLDKTRFLAAASHDILQPLNAARLYAHALLETPAAAAPDRGVVQNIDASLEAVEEILGALLDISRLDAGAMPANPSVLAIGELIDRLAVEFAPLARGKGIELRVVPSSLHVRTDRKLLRRLMQNLVSNAVKYTRTGRVLIGCRRRGDQVEVAVLDTGPGIPASQQHLIYKEFQRLEATASGTRGLGLGLSIVERIARVLDVTVDLRSQVGRGTAFAVRLPMADAAAAVLPAATGPLYGRIAGTAVLCIDNEPAIRASMEALLARWHCSVVTAHDLEEALAQLESTGFRPDVVLADYHLDRATGLEAIAGVRAACGAEIPAYILTADHSDEVDQRVRAAGLVALRKPIKPAALRAALGKVGLARLAAE